MVDAQDPIAHQHKGEGLECRQQNQEADFCAQVAETAQVEERFPLKNFPVLDDLLGAHAHAHEQDHHNRHKKVGNQAFVLEKDVVFPFGKAGEIGNNGCQNRRFEKIDQQVLLVGQLGAKVSLEKDQKLFQ